MYRVTNWNEYFETHKTRILKTLDWVPIPNKMDGDGYTELVDHPDGAAHYGVWVALLLIASKSSPRGDLARSGGVPHDIASLARVTRLQSAVIAPAIARLLKIGWMAVDGDDPALSGADAAQTGRRIEEKRIEQKGIEKVFASPKNGSAATHGSRFTEETLPNTWISFCYDELGWGAERAAAVFEKFRDYWIAQPGAKGRKADWLATWRNWCRKEAADESRAVQRNGRRPGLLEILDQLDKEDTQ